MEKRFARGAIWERMRRSGLIAAAAGTTLVAEAQGWQLATNLFLRADLSVKETYDSNVYLQNREPSPTVPNAVQPYQDSFVTAVTPRVALDWKACSGFNTLFSYAPEVVTYHAEPSESHVAHRTAATFSGQVGIVQWEQFNTLTYIDGSQDGLTFGGPPLPSAGISGGNAPAIGGISIRDRRAALLYRNGFRAYHPHGPWFFRPVAWSYVHDFKTKQRNEIGYQNYVDRNDFTVGMDTGYKAFKDAYLVFGYRYGFQQEDKLPWSNYHYSNEYHRFVAGFEGKVTDWLKIVGVAGPDIRDFDHDTAPGFDDDQVVLYYDASIVVTPTKQDTATILLRQFEQPAFGTPSVYEDITWEINWKHQFTAKFAASAGFRAYGGNWVDPVRRDDWIYTPSASASYLFNTHLSGEVAYSYDCAVSDVANTSGREFTRSLVSVGLKYAF